MSARVSQDFFVNCCFRGLNVNVLLSSRFSSRKLFSSKKKRPEIVLKFAQIHYLYYNCLDFGLVSCRCVLQLINLGHAKRDSNNLGISAPLRESIHLYRAFEKIISDLFGPFHAQIFLSSEKPFLKVFDATDETKTL